MKEIYSQLEKALMYYTSGSHYDDLVKAKEEYFALTGKINEDDEDYELRMNSFNDWFLFQYCSHLNEYLENEVENPKVKEAFGKVNYSLFEFIGDGLFRKRVVMDILHNKKISLVEETPISSLVKNDLFVGRVLEVNDKGILLNGLCFLPSEIRPNLIRHTKKLRKMNEPNQEQRFLINLEAQRSRWARYGHLSPHKFFVFEN
ncbi:MAG: hypothetical protein ACO20H_09645 [Bacteriovoracaceae bacterium]